VLLELRANVLSTGLRVRRFYRDPLHVVYACLAGAISAVTAISILSGFREAARQEIDGPLPVPLSVGVT
jgi:hypothetical protein